MTIAKNVLNFKTVWCTLSVADPGFPVGGRALVRGRGPLMWARFGENVCKNKRIGSHGGACAGHARPP